MQQITRNERQRAVKDWASRTFGAAVALDGRERAQRFVEEAIELAQACDLHEEDVREILARVYSRPVGEMTQEVGGVGVTLLALCEAAGVSADDAESAELARVLSIPAEHFRAKQAAKARAGTARMPEINPLEPK